MHLSCYDSSVTGYGHAGGGCLLDEGMLELLVQNSEVDIQKKIFKEE